MPDDEEAFVALFQDTQVSRWIGDGPSPEAEDRALFWRVFDVYAEERFDVWGVRLDGRLVGHAEIKPSKTVDGHELIYALSPAVWRRGLGTELAAAIVDYGFDTLALPEVYATVAAPNTASLRVLTKVGFEHVRDIPKDEGGTTRVLVRRRPAGEPAPASPQA